MTQLATSNRADLPEADYEWMADYIGGRLSLARKQEFEQRLISDRHFYGRMLPFLSAQYPVEPLPIELEVRARVAARIAAGERSAAARAARKRRMKGFVDAVAGVLFPGPVVGGLLAFSTLVAAAIAEWPTPAMPVIPTFVHVIRSAPTTPSLTAPTTVVTAQVTVPRSDSTVVAVVDPSPFVGTTGDSAADRVLAELGVSPTPGLALTPMTTQIEPDPERIALTASRLPFRIDTLPGQRQSPFDFVAGVVRRVVTLLKKPLSVIHKSDPHKFVPYLPPTPPRP